MVTGHRVSRLGKGTGEGKRFRCWKWVGSWKCGRFRKRECVVNREGERGKGSGIGLSEVGNGRKMGGGNGRVKRGRKWGNSGRKECEKKGRWECCNKGRWK